MGELSLVIIKGIEFWNLEVFAVWGIYYVYSANAVESPKYTYK